MEVFLNNIKEGVDKLRKTSEVVKIVTHLDADGLSFWRDNNKSS